MITKLSWVAAAACGAALFLAQSAAAEIWERRTGAPWPEYVTQHEDGMIEGAGFIHITPPPGLPLNWTQHDVDAGSASYHFTFSVQPVEQPATGCSLFVALVDGSFTQDEINTHMASTPPSPYLDAQAVGADLGPLDYTNTTGEAPVGAQWRHTHEGAYTVNRFVMIARNADMAAGYRKCWARDNATAERLFAAFAARIDLE